MIETTVMKELTKYVKNTEYGLLTVAKKKFQKDVLENFVNLIGPCEFSVFLCLLL